MVEIRKDITEVKAQTDKNKAKKTFIKAAIEYMRKYQALKAVFAFAVIGAAVSCPPTIPVIVATGAAIAYAGYKKKNPKSTFKHYAQSELKNHKNQVLLGLQATSVGQTIMQAKKRIEQHKRGLKEGEQLQEVESPLMHMYQRSTTAKINGIKPSPMLFSEDAQRARRLNHIRIVNIEKDLEK